MTVVSENAEWGLSLNDRSQTLPRSENLDIFSHKSKDLFSPRLIVRKISKVFEVSGEKIQAIKDIDFTINTGEFVSMVGPSGCGKTTLLNIIAGLERPDKGEIISLQEDPLNFNFPNDRLLIFQESSLFPWLNVYENVAYGLKLRKVPHERIDYLVNQYLSLVNLIKFKEAFIHQLSGGMKQRVVLARALVLEPKILLMDEPFAALDVQTRKDMYQLLLEVWHKTKKTILFITHNVDEALTLSNRILVMGSHPGRIKKEFCLEMGYPRILEQSNLKQLRMKIVQELIDDRTVGMCQGGPTFEKTD